MPKSRKSTIVRKPATMANSGRAQREVPAIKIEPICPSTPTTVSNIGRGLPRIYTMKNGSTYARHFNGRVVLEDIMRPPATSNTYRGRAQPSVNTEPENAIQEAITFLKRKFNENIVTLTRDLESVNEHYTVEVANMQADHQTKLNELKCIRNKAIEDAKKTFFNKINN